MRRNISIRGWLDGGYTGNFNDAPSNFNGPVTFNDREEAQFNQAYVILERPIDTDALSISSMTCALRFPSRACLALTDDVGLYRRVRETIPRRSI